MPMRVLVRLIHGTRPTRSSSIISAMTITTSTLQNIPQDKNLLSLPMARNNNNVKSLAYTRAFHARILISGLSQDIMLWTTLITMYMKSNNIEDARRVFDKMPERDLASWNAIIVGYCRSGFAEEAVRLYYQMQRETKGVRPDNIVFSMVLGACAGLGDLKQGRKIHEEIKESGYERDVIVGNALVAMYARCGSMEDAQQLFDKMAQRDVILWTAMIVGYARSNEGGRALDFFRQMVAQGVRPDSRTVGSVLSVCGELKALDRGKELHGFVIRRESEWNTSVWNGLVEMYQKCGAVEDAYHVFEKRCRRNVVLRDDMIAKHLGRGPREGATGGPCFKKSYCHGKD